MSTEVASTNNVVPGPRHSAETQPEVQFLLEAQQAGVHLFLTSDCQLGYRCAKSALSADMRYQLRQHKEALLDLLQWNLDGWSHLSPAAVVAILRARRHRLEIHGDRLRLIPPASDWVRAEVIFKKTEVCLYLSREPAPSWQGPGRPPLCYHCGQLLPAPKDQTNVPLCQECGEAHQRNTSAPYVPPPPPAPVEGGRLVIPAPPPTLKELLHGLEEAAAAASRETQELLDEQAAAAAARRKAAPRRGRFG